jgi:carboxyl-terminal processing protease
MPKRNLIYVLAIVVAVAITFSVWRQASPLTGLDGSSGSAMDHAAELIRQHYYRPVDDEALERTALEAMANSLDCWSRYVGPELAGRLSDHILAGSDPGLGLVVEPAGDGWRVLGAICGSPAHQAGLAEGELLAIDGEPVAAMSEEDVRERLRVEPGDVVDLAIEDSGGDVRTVSLEGRLYPVETVEGLLRDESGRWIHPVDPLGQTAYVRVTEFVEGTAQQLQRVLRQMGHPRCLVLDLRDNPGGLLTAAVATCNLLLEEGLIVTSVGRDEQRHEYRALRSGTLRDLYVVVLVNENTASAAEIVAGALKYNDRAVIIGERTHGKGSVQSIFDLPDDQGQLVLTTGEYLVGDGVAITRHPGSETWGIEPHEKIELTGERAARLERLVLLGRLMPPPQTQTSDSARTRPAVEDELQRPTLAQLLSLDLQLARAVGLLAEPSDVERMLRNARRQRQEDNESGESIPAAEPSLERTYHD